MRVRTRYAIPTFMFIKNGKAVDKRQLVQLVKGAFLRVYWKSINRLFNNHYFPCTQTTK